MGMLVLRVPLWAMGMGLGILLRPCRINRIQVGVLGMLELAIVLYLMIVPVFLVQSQLFYRTWLAGARVIASLFCLVGFKSDGYHFL
jgi:hypothetical protein